MLKFSFIFEHFKDFSSVLALKVETESSFMIMETVISDVLGGSFVTE